MALTRAMAAKLASQSSDVDQDLTSSQRRNSPRHRYPSSSSTSSASSSSSFSPPHTPTSLVTGSPLSISLVSQINNFVQHASQPHKFNDMLEKAEYIKFNNRMSNVEESISDQRFIINELERESSIITDRLIKISSSNRSDITSS